MNLRMLSLVPYQKKYLILGLYGYACNGVPGLNLVGLGARGTSLREKVIYLSRENALQVPFKRYVISVEGHEEMLCNKEREGLKYLELAVVMIYWMMTGHLDLRRPENCLVSGHIGLDGKVRSPLVAKEFWKKLNGVMGKSARTLTVIGPRLNSPSMGKNYHYLNYLEASHILKTLVSPSRLSR